MIDTHSHIDFEEYGTNFKEFIEELKTEEIENVIIPGVNTSGFERIIKLCNENEMLYGAIGIHPTEFNDFKEGTEKLIYECLNCNKIKAIGEIGLDYYYGKDDKEEQKKILRKQLKIAEETQLPVIIHDRESHEDIFEILAEYKLKKVIMHCFSGDSEFAEKCCERGYYIGIGGVVTFKNAIKLKEAVRITPIENIVLETDAPYLTPVPFRGKVNSPKYLKYIAEEIAKIKEINIEEVKKITSENAKRIFNI